MSSDEDVYIAVPADITSLEYSNKKATSAQKTAVASSSSNTTLVQRPGGTIDDSGERHRGSTGLLFHHESGSGSVVEGWAEQIESHDIDIESLGIPEEYPHMPSFTRKLSIGLDCF